MLTCASQPLEVWIFNCIDTKSPPNTGAGPNAGLPDGGNATATVLSAVWPLLAVAAWQWRRRQWADAA